MPHKGEQHSAETCAKISASHLGKTLLAEHRAKISAASRGRTFSPETRAKISEANRARLQSVEHRAITSSNRALRLERGEHSFGATKILQVQGLHCQGSYERRFVETCFAANVIVERGKRKPYVAVDGSGHQYVPDFYLPEYGVHVECKGEHILACDLKKMYSCINRHEDFRLVVITADWLCMSAGYQWSSPSEPARSA